VNRNRLAKQGMARWYRIRYILLTEKQGMKNFARSIRVIFVTGLKTGKVPSVLMAGFPVSELDCVIVCAELYIPDYVPFK